MKVGQEVLTLGHLVGSAGSQPPILRAHPKVPHSHKLRYSGKGLVMNDQTFSSLLSLLSSLLLWSDFTLEIFKDKRPTIKTNDSPIANIV